MSIRMAVHHAQLKLFSRSFLGAMDESPKFPLTEAGKESDSAD